MSELRVDTLKPALNPSKITITPGVVVTDNTDMEQFEVTSSGEIKVLGPLRVGSSVSNTPGSSSQVLTSQGTGLPPVWTEGFPIGGIIIWYGSATAIPRGWALCNGDEVNGYKTPNLTNRFIVGAGGSYTINQNGGNADAVVVAHTHASAAHTHTVGRSPMNFNGRDNTSVRKGAYPGYRGQSPPIPPKPTGLNEPGITRPSGWGADDNYTTDPASPTISSSGESGTGKNLPPYYALCYIMRVPTS
jgi:microcystin-dependent protein